MSNDEKVVLENVSVHYPSWQYNPTLKKSFLGLLGSKIDKPNQTHDHLKSVSLRLVEGERIGIIGRNGAGKSTLLRVIAGIIKPYTGQVLVNGRITPLLDLGTGIQTELTCQENVFLASSYLRISRREAFDKLEDILEWSELGEYRNLAVHELSSGMRARLSFAISTSQDPDIILIDEALSVGDISFVEKSKIRLNELCDRGSLVVIVSHNLPFLSEFVNRVAWIDEGKLHQQGNPKEIISLYTETYG